MRGDFSRRTFRATSHYSSVRLQQGRVLVDADWHEQIDIDQHRDRTTTRDVVGRTGAPIATAGFAVGPAVDLSGVAMVDPATAIAVGGRLAVLTTADGGVTWRRRPLPDGVPQGTLSDVHLATAQVGAAVGANGVILTTDDGGQTWTQRSAAGVTGMLNGVRFADASTAIAVGDGNIVVVGSGTGTPTWAVASTVPAGPDPGLQAVERVGGGVWALVGLKATIMTSSDGGATWTVRTPPSEVTADLLAVAFASPSDGWAVGSGGTILRSQDGGQTWAKQSSGVTVTLRGVSFADADRGWAVGDAGTVLRTTDGGTTWEAEQLPAAPGAATAVAVASPTTAIAVGAGFTLYGTTDAG